jgi:hypothetical protein
VAAASARGIERGAHGAPPPSPRCPRRGDRRRRSSRVRGSASSPAPKLGLGILQPQLSRGVATGGP